MKRMMLGFLFLAGLMEGQVIVSFSPQENISSRVSLWSVAACPTKVISITTIYTVATHHGIRWISPKTATELFEKKSAWSRVVKVAGFLSLGGAVVANSEWAKGNPKWTARLALGGTALVVLVPLAQKEIPRVDPFVGAPLTPEGCITSFYAEPSNIAGFNEVMP